MSNTIKNIKKISPGVVAEALGLALLPFLVFVNYNYEDFYISPALITGIILYAICAFGIAISRRTNRAKTHFFVKGYFALVSIDLFVIGVTAVRQKKITIAGAAFLDSGAVYVGAAHVFLAAVIVSIIVWVTFIGKKA
jgi:hypothetical protein